MAESPGTCPALLLPSPYAPSKAKNQRGEKSYAQEPTKETKQSYCTGVPISNDCEV